MPQTVGDVSYQIHIFAFIASQKAVNSSYQNLDDVDVLPLVEASDIIGLGNFSSVEDKINGTGMVFHKKPVAYVLAFAINGEWFAMTDIVDEKRYQLFGKLIRPVVVGAIGDDRWHSVGVMVGTDKMVAACFRGGIRAVRIVFRFFVKEIIPVCQMMFSRRCCGGKRRFDTFGWFIANAPYTSSVEIW